MSVLKGEIRLKMKKKIVSFCLSVITAVSFTLSVGFGVNASDRVSNSYSKRENEVIIYDFVKKEFGVNDAAACGILANIYCESTYEPTATAIEADGGISYGICQWHLSRYEALQSFCAENGYDYTSLEGQLYYLKYELETSEKSAYSRIKNVPETAEGAYEASYNWARYFERCASVYHNQRAALARDSFWPIYGHSPAILTARGVTYPVTLKSGAPYSVYGSVVSPYLLTSVEVSLTYKSGEQIFGYNYRADGTDGEIYYMDLHTADTKILFSDLPDGTYDYRVCAKDTHGYTVDIVKPFTVGDSATSGLTENEVFAYHDHEAAAEYSWDSGIEIIAPTVDEEGLVLYTCFCGESKTEPVPMLSAEYTVTYDAAGGTDAPFAQGKAVDKAIKLRVDAPIREGYEFLGWTDRQESNEVKYAPGDVYSDNASVVLYAVWHKTSVDVEGILLSENIIYGTVGDVSVLTASVVPDNADNKKVVWNSSAPDIVSVDENGTVSLAAFGTAVITVQSEDGGYAASCKVASASPDHKPGDVNGDGRVTSADLTRLMKLIAGEDVDVYFPDVNGDGRITSADLTRLMKALAGVEGTELFGANVPDQSAAQ